MNKIGQNKARFAVIFGGILVLTVVSATLGLAWPVMTVEAGPTLPPRDFPAEDEVEDTDDGDKDSDLPVGAYIELQAQAFLPETWSVVQWQDSAGGWHDVEGWQGGLGPTGYRRWWVAAKDFNTGPFRWAITRGPAGEMLGVSEPFNLPGEANHAAKVTVSPGS